MVKNKDLWDIINSFGLQTSVEQIAWDSEDEIKSQVHLNAWNAVKYFKILWNSLKFFFFSWLNIFRLLEFIGTSNT